MRRWQELLPEGSAVPFARFMELALYHPELGYYCKPRKRYPAGPGGDFVTAPTAHPSFARTWARLFQALARRRGSALVLVELGAGDGSFLRPLLAASQGEVFQRVVAVEVSPAGRAALQALGAVEVVADLGAASPPAGPVVVFASELYDALPFHLVRGGKGGELEELFVDWEDGALRFKPGPPSSPALATYLERHGVRLLPGQVAEVRLAAAPFHEHVLAWAGEEALVFVLDYGYPAATLYNPKLRRLGSLAGYKDQKPVADVLALPGEVDITAHVNWDDLHGAARKLHFATAAAEPLGLFLARWGILEEARKGLPPEAPTPWEVKALLAPAGMGSDLKVLVQGKGALWACWQELEAASRL